MASQTSPGVRVLALNRKRLTYNSSGMDFSAGSLVLSLAIGAVGTGLFLYGKAQRRIPQLVGGIVLTVYPYFIPNLWVMGGIAVGIVLVVWLATLKGM
jgi:hypothetical protein